MDWTEDTTYLSARDWEIFGYGEGKTVIARKLSGSQTTTTEIVTGDFAWGEWLKDQPEQFSSPGLYILFCSRAADVFLGQSAPVSYLPFSKKTWQLLSKRWHVHRAITRTISRQVAYLSVVSPACPGIVPSEIHFTARMSAYLSNDIALSVTYTPSRNLTFAVFYGCNHRQVHEVEKRIRSAGFATDHPLLMVAIFAELERERLISLGDDLVDKFSLGSEILENECWNPERDLTSQKTKEYLALCLQSRGLIDHIRAVKRQLVKLINQVEEIDTWLFKASDGSSEECQRELRLKHVGNQIRKRIREILDEYDDKIDECRMMSDNLSLAMQTLWNQIARHDSKINTQIAQINTTISLETKRDNAQMRSIALLTMIYIPLSCVASVFSTSLFDFQAAEGKAVVSDYFWVFLIVAVGLTALTVLVWYFATNRDIKKEKRSNSFALKDVGMV